MNENSRTSAIAKLLYQNRQMSVADLADILQVTPTTIRRDLIEMESLGQVIRRRGYALAPVDSATPFYKDNLFSHEKQRIAAKAAEYVNDHTSIALDSGSSVRALVQYLIDEDRVKDLDIVTPSLVTATEACAKYRVALPGGYIIPEERSLGGVDVTEFFGQVRTDIAFLGSTGVLNSRGLTVSNPLMREVKNSLTHSATMRIALLDSSKYVFRGIYTFCTFDDLDVLITVETPENRQFLDEIARHKVKIELV